MEKAPGVQLFQKREEMAEIEKLELIKNLTDIEAQFSAIRFPAYGGLYHRTSASDLKYRYLALDGSVDPSNSFRIGPSSDRSFTVVKGGVDQGPCEYSVTTIP